MQTKLHYDDHLWGCGVFTSYPICPPLKPLHYPGYYTIFFLHSVWYHFFCLIYYVWMESSVLTLLVIQIIIIIHTNNMSFSFSPKIFLLMFFTEKTAQFTVRSEEQHSCFLLGSHTKTKSPIIPRSTCTIAWMSFSTLKTKCLHCTGFHSHTCIQGG